MKTRTCMFDGILFDMDGVLVDSEPIHYRAEDQIFQKMGISLSEEMRRSFTGISNDLMWETIRKHLSITRPAADLKREAEEMRLDYFSNLAELEPTAGAEDLLKLLTETGTGIALASSSAPGLIELILRMTGLAVYFPHWVSGEEVAMGKPAPDVFLEAASRLGLKPDRCCVIEDSRNGIRAGKDAGMTVYAFRGTAENTMDLSAADAIFTSFSDISLSLFEGS